MSRAIAIHVVAGILVVGVGTPDAQESISKPAVVEARDTRTSNGVLPTTNDSSSPKNDTLEPGVLFRLDCVAGIQEDVGVDDPNNNIEGRQNSAKSSRDASDSPQAKAGTKGRWFTGAMLRVLEFVVTGLVNTSGK